MVGLIHRPIIFMASIGRMSYKRFIFSGLLLLLVGGYFLPWIQLEVVPVWGVYLPALAAEQFGSGHLMHLLSFAYLLTPMWAIARFWRVGLGGSWPKQTELYLAVVWLLLTGGYLAYLAADSILTLRLLPGFYVSIGAGLIACGYGLWIRPITNKAS